MSHVATVSDPPSVRAVSPDLVGCVRGYREAHDRRRGNAGDLWCSGYHPGMRGPFGQLVIFVLVLIGINVVAQLLGLNIRISIIGSIVLTLIVGGIMGATRRR